jgi:MFS family permease
VTSIYKEEKERFIGYIESSAGVGLLVGPILGTIFYSLGGYMLPFVVLGLAYFIIYPLITIVLMKLKKFEEESPRKQRG